MDNIDEEYDRLVEHLHDCAKKAESFKTTKRRLSLETLELIRQRGAPRAAGNQELTSELAKLCREAMKEDLKERIAEVLAEAAEAGKAYAASAMPVETSPVASRTTMQIAGLLLILLGLFTKMAALLASIPDALIGGVLTMGISMIAGVAMSNLQLIDLKLTRNLSILGLSLMIGNKEWDQIVNMLLSIKMLVGGVVAVVLDNTVPGATLRQRGLQSLEEDEKITIEQQEEDGYAFPECVNRVLRAFPCLRLLPFLPSHPPPKPPPSRDQSISVPCDVA
ncbi:hypothetical protein NECAME_17227 [Necator americanus]|uniref:Uncharacterized protein n=1 Tax=Necator americanus TaxID=51031 RepID=W2TSQ7_NECAM|nr:hypothetical protein NECAME_17227 [Necator americanus]ETN84156.1 hypothetical protein NECAME_17227 [Necator americanus]